MVIIECLFTLEAEALWLFNTATENGPLIDGLPIKHGDFPWLCQITRWYPIYGIIEINSNPSLSFINGYMLQLWLPG